MEGGSSSGRSSPFHRFFRPLPLFPSNFCPRELLSQSIGSKDRRRRAQHDPSISRRIPFIGGATRANCRSSFSFRNHAHGLVFPAPQKKFFILPLPPTFVAPLYKWRITPLPFSSHPSRKNLLPTHVPSSSSSPFQPTPFSHVCSEFHPFSPPPSLSHCLPLFSFLLLCLLCKFKCSIKMLILRLLPPSIES